MLGLAGKSASLGDRARADRRGSNDGNRRAGGCIPPGGRASGRDQAPSQADAPMSHVHRGHVLIPWPATRAREGVLAQAAQRMQFVKDGGRMA